MGHAIAEAAAAQGQSRSSSSAPSTLGASTELAASGNDIGPDGTLIASSAPSLGSKVVTANARHFNGITGLDVAACAFMSPRRQWLL